MAAYVIGHITVRDEEKWAEYRRSVPATLLPWGGEVLLRGHVSAVLAGEHAHRDAVVLRFPDAAALAAWHASAAYQALLPLRRAAAAVDLIAVEDSL